ncbi:Dihydrolipoamide succinyltransferase component (E2) of 2-oxoglutarate dehydrogenase complex [hydrothermal vent metagenome]|uniref:dihydrolipoyllysine-residue succinyltransferase n=1 Tax=hydrothermal vent metagenome TaxID=652676 RepID=A0A3B0XHJ9_9ZZZZ
MATEVKVPDLPESVSDATIVTWRKKVGDSINRDESLVDLETDKVVLEVPSPIDGIITEIKQQEGDVVEAGQLLAVLTEQEIQSTTTNDTNEKIITPSAKKMIAENKLDENAIVGSGKDGRVLKEDVQDYMQKTLATNQSEKSKSSAQFEIVEKNQPETTQVKQTQEKMLHANSSSDLASSSSAEERIEKRVPMTRLRTRIAERLMDAQHNAAILTTFNEVNMQPVMDLRNKYKEVFAKKYAVKLGFMSFFVKAAIEALKRFPAVNASIDGGDIVYHGFFDIGVAVASPRGLVVPILRDAEQMSLAEIEMGIADLVDKAKNNRLTIEDMTGGTFSLTNGGVFGSMLSTPIINPPQSGILGMHKIQQRAMVVDDEIIAQPMMYLALSYDHRIIDGAEAVQFLVTIKDVLEDPARIIVGV